MSAPPLIQTLAVGPLQCNCSVLADASSREAVVIDPGAEPERILRVLRAMDVRPVALLHTHAHFDHIGGTRRVREATGAAIHVHPADGPLYDRLPDQAAFFGIAAEPPAPVDAPISDGETFSFGRHLLTAIHTPGHTPGSTCFLLSGDAPALFSGDTLFRRSIGRTDLRGGDTEAILASIRTRLYALPDDTPVVCGHGPGTTIGEEKRGNPFVRA